MNVTDNTVVKCNLKVCELPRGTTFRWQGDVHILTCTFVRHDDINNTSYLRAFNCDKNEEVELKEYYTVTALEHELEILEKIPDERFAKSKEEG